MRWKAVLPALLLSLALSAQTRMSVRQLVEFVRSSIGLKHPDKQVAAYLRKVELSERLDDRTIEDLEGAGAGPKTVEALRELRDASKGLAAPAPAPPKPAPVKIPPPGEAEQKQVIDQVRGYALNYSKTLPNFICTQVTRRYVDPTGLEFWSRQDVITARLSYFEQKEDYKVVLVNNRPVDVPMTALGGTITRSEFGTQLRELFEPLTRARFRWERWTTLRGRRAHVYWYAVDGPNSEFSVAYHDLVEPKLPYHGFVYVDRDSESVVRLTLEPVLPVSFPLQNISMVLDYDFAEIAGHQYLLPLRAVWIAREGKTLNKNEVEFRMYRRFAAEATITFDTPEPLPEEKTKEQPPR